LGEIPNIRCFVADGRVSPFTTHIAPEVARGIRFGVELWGVP